MDIFLIIGIIIVLIFGLFLGKWITDKTKWSDKRKLVEEKWKSRLDSLEKDYKTQLLEMKKDNELNINKISHNWELKYSTELGEIKELIQRAEKWMRNDAIKRSKRTLLGKLWEQVAPYIPKFPFKPSDMKFLGAPIDFVIFDGMGEKDIKQVVFLEVKSGDSKLSTQERNLKNVINAGKVKWKLFNVDKPEKIKIDEIDERHGEDEIDPHELYSHIDEKISSAKETIFEADEFDTVSSDKWKCDFCGKKFKTEEECDEHEQICDER